MWREILKIFGFWVESKQGLNEPSRCLGHFKVHGQNWDIFMTFFFELYQHRSSKSKANNTADSLAIRFFAAFSQPTHIVVGSLQLIHGPLVSLTDFLGSCAQTGCKLTTYFSSLSSSLSSTSTFSRLTACYYTCSKACIHSTLHTHPYKTCHNETRRCLRERRIEMPW